MQRFRLFRPGRLWAEGCVRFWGVSFALLAPIAAAMAQPAGPWSLARCIEHAQANSLEMRGAQLDVRGAEGTLWQSKWDFAPTLSAGGQYGLNFGRAIDFGSNTVSNDLQSLSFSVSANMTLFSGLSRMRTVQANRLALEAQEAHRDAIRHDLALSVTQAYLQVLYQNELLSTRREQLALGAQQVALGEMRAAAGSIPQGALLDLKAQLAAEQQGVVEAENALTMSRIGLMQLLDLRDTTGFVLQSPVADSASLPQLPALSPQQIYDEALAKYPSVREAALLTERAERGVQIARGRYYPRLSLSASYGSGSRHFLDRQSHPNEDPFLEQVKANASQSVGLSLSIPIFDGFATREGVSQARISHERSKLNQQRVENALYRTIQQAYADAVAAYRRYLSAYQSVASLREAFRWAEQKLELGAISSYDYSQAKSRLAQAQTSLLQAKFEYLFKVKILDYYRGEPLNL